MNLTKEQMINDDLNKCKIQLINLTKLLLKINTNYTFTLSYQNEMVMNLQRDAELVSGSFDTILRSGESKKYVSPKNDEADVSALMPLGNDPLGNDPLENDSVLTNAINGPIIFTTSSRSIDGLWRPRYANTERERSFSEQSEQFKRVREFSENSEKWAKVCDATSNHTNDNELAKSSASAPPFTHAFSQVFANLDNDKVMDISELTTEITDSVTHHVSHSIINSISHPIAFESIKDDVPKDIVQKDVKESYVEKAKQNLKTDNIDKSDKVANIRITPFPKSTKSTKLTKNIKTKDRKPFVYDLEIKPGMYLDELSSYYGDDDIANFNDFKDIKFYFRDPLMFNKLDGLYKLKKHEEVYYLGEDGILYVFDDKDNLVPGMFNNTPQCWRDINSQKSI